MMITVYSKDQCQACDAVKRLLTTKGLAFDEIKLDDDAERQRFYDANPGIRQMPQVFIEGQRVGGYAGVQAALAQLDL
jgi:glutaredoxin 3